MIPTDIRRRLNIEPGDKLRWNTGDDDSLSVEIIQQRYGTFDGFEHVSMGGDGLETIR